MTYIDFLATDIYLNTADGVMEPENFDDMPLYRFYALLCLAKGTATTAEDVHNAWAAWRSETQPDHHSIVPFSELRPAVQALDEPYVQAIHATARKIADPIDREIFLGSR